ncbi:Sugar phosphate isomerase/epimerase [Desulfacinum hydrothermale DSM 13146]|uniref:Sugar phosphate isomerase/epimerase n=1 Tax=Desulfacinum hydrothermale DSM 13146 TaxID=1121390 RepID=A0A1W1XIW1_9BACT|nr:TIM barrel protein [Desulfacinum hydrothermale]SMC23714.1 Sugar phosphate isomerase/epimerase [Desulfacinum hydrothermale DSM 13146]
MRTPKLALPNFVDDVDRLRDLALELGAAGIDWSFRPHTLPQTPLEQTRLARLLARLQPLEVRYHAALPHLDPGDRDPERAEVARKAMERLCRVTARLGGRVLTLHVGLGRSTTQDLSWHRTLDNLKSLNDTARTLGIRLCLENLAWGWTSRPDLYEKMLRKTGLWATLDIGHAAVSPSITSQQFEMEDLVSPHADRFLNAHVYHLEVDDHHIPPERASDVSDRLDLIWELPFCDWWVLELRDEHDVRKAHGVVHTYVDQKEALEARQAQGVFLRM